MKGKFSDNPYYVEYERLLKELHRLIAEGKGDTDAADAIRDAMDDPWRKLSRAEIDRLDGLSADLYMLQGDEIYEPLDPAERTSERLGADIEAAVEREEWEKLLALLRKGPTFLPQHRVASLRAKAYEALGHPDTARLFWDYAARLDPQKVVSRQ